MAKGRSGNICCLFLVIFVDLQRFFLRWSPRLSIHRDDHDDRSSNYFQRNIHSLARSTRSIRKWINYQPDAFSFLSFFLSTFLSIVNLARDQTEAVWSINRGTRGPLRSIIDSYRVIKTFKRFFLFDTYCNILLPLSRGAALPSSSSFLRFLSLESLVCHLSVTLPPFFSSSELVRPEWVFLVGSHAEPVYGVNTTWNTRLRADSVGSRQAKYLPDSLFRLSCSMRWFRFDDSFFLLLFPS